jgi:hypothetical protein
MWTCIIAIFLGISVAVRVTMRVAVRMIVGATATIVRVRMFL